MNNTIVEVCEIATDVASASAIAAVVAYLVTYDVCLVRNDASFSNSI